MTSNNLCVPAGALQVEGTNPEIGDIVDVSISGKVTKIDGDNIYITPETANGEEIKPVKSEPSKPKRKTAADEENEMRQLAKESDETY